MGPGALLPPGEDFESNSVRMIFHDSNEPERVGLGVRKMHRILTPHLLENPIDFMITGAPNNGRCALTPSLPSC